MAQFRSESSASETEGLMRDLKRQKNITNGGDHIQNSTELVDSGCDLDLKSGKDAGAHLPANAPNDLFSNPSTSICSFCQSSKTSEVIFDMHQIPAHHYCLCLTLLP